jgi:hypothetical protein
VADELHDTEADGRDQRVDEAILAYLKEVDEGRPPDPQEFLRRYPDLSVELEAFFTDHLRVARLTAGWSPERGGVAVRAPRPALRAIGGYRLGRLLGAGGMGEVYEAEDAGGRRVAVKLLAAADEPSRLALERFRREGWQRMRRPASPTSSWN